MAPRQTQVTELEGMPEELKRNRPPKHHGRWFTVTLINENVYYVLIWEADKPLENRLKVYNAQGQKDGRSTWFANIIRPYLKRTHTTT